MEKKNIFKSLLLVSVAALALVACKKAGSTTKKTTTGNKTQIVTTSNKTTKTTNKTTEKNNTTKEAIVDTYSKCYTMGDDFFVKLDVEEKKLTNIILSSGVGYCLYLKPVIENNKYVSLQAINPINDEPGLNPSYKLIKNSDTASQLTSFQRNELSKTNEKTNAYSSVSYDANLCVKLNDEKITLYFNGNTYEFNMDGTTNKKLEEITATPTNVFDYFNAKFENDVLETACTFGEFKITLKKDSFILNYAGYDSCKMNILDNSIKITNYYSEYGGPVIALDDLTYTLDNDLNLIKETSYIEELGIKEITTYTYSSDKNQATLNYSTEYENGNVSNKKDYDLLTYDEYSRLIKKESYTDNDGVIKLSNNIEYTYDDFGRTTSCTKNNNKTIYEYDDNNHLIKTTYQEKDGPEFVTKKYVLYEYTNNKLSGAKYYDYVSIDTSYLTRSVHEEYDEFGNLLLYENIVADGLNNYSTDTFIIEYKYDSNNRLINVKIHGIKSEGNPFYLAFEHNYTYSIEDNFNVVTDEKITYNTSEEIDHKLKEITKENDTTKIWQELHYNGSGYSIYIEETTTNKGNGIYERNKVYFYDNGSKNYGETTTYNLKNYPKSALEDRNIYEQLQTYSIFFRYNGDTKVTTGEIYYNEYGYANKDIDYSYDDEGRITRVVTTELVPSDNFYMSKKINEITEYYDYDEKIYEVEKIEYFVDEELLKSEETKKYDLDTKELIETETITYELVGTDSIKQTKKETIQIDKENHTKTTSLYTYTDYNGTPLILTYTITVLNTTSNKAETKNYECIYNESRNALLRVVEYEYNNSLDKWLPYREYLDLDNIDGDPLVEYFYKDNKLYSKEYYSFDEYTHETKTEYFDSEGKLIAREIEEKDYYEGKLYEINYLKDIILGDDDYDNYIEIKKYNVINDELYLYHKLELDDNNNKLYLICGSFNESKKAMDYVDVIIYDENGNNSSVTRYVNDFESNTHSTYTLKDEYISEYEPDYYEYYEIDSNFTLVDGEENVSGIISSENAPHPNN